MNGLPRGGQLRSRALGPAGRTEVLEVVEGRAQLWPRVDPARSAAQPLAVRQPRASGLEPVERGRVDLERASRSSHPPSRRRSSARGLVPPAPAPRADPWPQPPAGTTPSRPLPRRTHRAAAARRPAPARAPGRRLPAHGAASGPRACETPRPRGRALRATARGRRARSAPKPRPCAGATVLGAPSTFSACVLQAASSPPTRLQPAEPGQGHQQLGDLSGLLGQPNRLAVVGLRLRPGRRGRLVAGDVEEHGRQSTDARLSAYLVDVLPQRPVPRWRHAATAAPASRTRAGAGRGTVRGWTGRGAPRHAARRRRPPRRPGCGPCRWRSARAPAPWDRSRVGASSTSRFASREAAGAPAR